MLKNIVHIGDIFAIPMFLLAIIYFYKIKDKNLIEYILFLFSIGGFLFDTLFTVMFFSDTYLKK
jgi:hypothetical protein